jgi:hypothetical protein
LIDSDLRQTVRILVPEGGAARPIAERCRALEHSARDRKPGIGRERGGSQPGYRIAAMIDVNDLG